MARPYQGIPTSAVIGGVKPKVVTAPGKTPPKKPPKPKPKPSKQTAYPTLQQLVDQITGPQMAEYTKQRSVLEQRQAQQQAALRQYQQSVQQYLAGLPGQIQNDYGTAIRSAADVAGAVGQALHTGPDSRTQALLQAVGAPVEQQQQLAQQNQNVAGGASVLGMLGGALPAENRIANQDSRLLYARSLPGIQALGGQQTLEQLLLSQGKDSAALDSAIADMKSKATGQAYTILDQLQRQRQAAANAASLNNYRNAQLKIAAGKAGAAAQGYSKTITRADGSVVGVRKDGSVVLLLPKGSVSQPYRGGTWSTKVLANGAVIQTNGKTGAIRQVAPPGSVLSPSAANTAKGKPKALTPPQLAAANKYLDSYKTGFWADTSTGKAVTRKDLATAAKAANMTVQAFLANNPKAQAKRDEAGIGYLSVDQHEDKHIQSLYLSLIRDYQVPARQAFQMIAKRYPQWAAAHKNYFPGNPNQAGGARFNTAAKVISVAKQFLGTPYKWGGASPQTGFDCSGLLTYAFGKQGIRLPHNAAAQFHMGTPVQPNDLQPGDAVFFITDGTAENPGHVGIYLGGGKVLTSPHTGAVVMIDQLAQHDGYVGARRYV